MINKYNLFKILCIGTVVSCFPIFILILIQQNLNIEINYQNVIFLFYPLIIFSILLFSLFLYHWFKSDIKYMLKGLRATYELRKFAHFESDSILDTQNKQISTQKSIVNKANRSLLTLSMIYTKDGAILRWQVPNNHESFLKVQEIFPAIKTKLHTMEPDLFFTNIAPSDGRWYQATGSYNHSRLK